MKIGNIKIGTRIAVGFGIIFSLLIATGLLGLLQIEKVSDTTQGMLRGDSTIARHAARLRADVLEMRRFEKDVFINIAQRDKVESYYKKWSEARENADQRIADLMKVDKTQKDFDTVTSIKSGIAEYYEGFGNVYRMILEGRIRTTVDANNAIGEYKDAIRKTEDTAQSFAAEGNTRMDRVPAMIAAVTKAATLMVLIIGFLSLAAGVVISILLTRSVTTPIRKVVDFAGKLSKGDFSERIDIRQKDEIGIQAKALNEAADNLEKVISELLDFGKKFAVGDFTGRIKSADGEYGMLSEIGKAFNSAVDDLERMISEIVVAVENLSQAVYQISSGNENLSQRTTEQASSLEEVASTIEEAASSIRQNSANSIEAKVLTDEGVKKSEEGGRVVVEAVNSITDINRASKKIGDIISVINEIAFQTNLLALNAAVEAARAGEQGRGFAVVAGEVRNLAQRSGNAAKEIASLIKDSSEKVETGTMLVNKSGESLNEIVESVRKVAQLISEVAAASAEQNKGLDQINIAVSELDTMTQQNAALVEETASASEEMSNQAQDLLSMMERFRISDTVQIRSKAETRKENRHSGDGNADKKKKSAPGGDRDKRKNFIKPGEIPVEKDLRNNMLSEGFDEF